MKVENMSMNIQLDPFEAKVLVVFIENCCSSSPHRAVSEKLGISVGTVNIVMNELRTCLRTNTDWSHE
jgi:hypothetical protein